MSPVFRERAPGPELMDLPGCDSERLLRTVRQFRIINRLFSRSSTLLEQYLLKPIIQSGRKAFSFVEPGAGGCDVPLKLVLRCRELGIHARVTCLERDPRIAALARRRCEGVPEIVVEEGDALAPGALHGFDFVFANNFLHHLDDAQITAFLKSLSEANPSGFLLNDLQRSFPAWVGYGLFASLFLHRSFARYDGMLSVRRGFRRKEMECFVRISGLKNAMVGQRLPAALHIYRPLKQ